MARYKYNHEDAEAPTPHIKLGSIIGLMVVALVGYCFAVFVLLHPFKIINLMSVIVGAIILSAIFFVRIRPRELEIHERYLICGRHCIHFGNIEALHMHTPKGKMRIIYNIGNNKRAFILDREKFPTNARKDFKIAANKQKKFDDISQKIIESAYQINPELIVEERAEQTRQQAGNAPLIGQS